MEGVITAEAGGGFFRVKVDRDGADHEVLAKLCGKMRKNKIHVIVGDKVELETSVHDLTRGRITFRVRA